MVYGEYVTDDGLVTCALLMVVDTFEVQGFWAPPRHGVVLKPQKLTPRRELFFSSVSGKHIALPYPTLIAPHRLGANVTIRGDYNYVKLATLSEINRTEIV
jgi:hypothetical protein